MSWFMVMVVGRFRMMILGFWMVILGFRMMVSRLWMVMISRFMMRCSMVRTIRRLMMRCRFGWVGSSIAFATFAINST